MSITINDILQSLKVSLGILLIIFISIGLFFILLVYKSYQDLNEVSKTASRNIYHSLVQQEQSQLGKLTQDYSFWTETVEAITGDLDYVFVEENFDGEFLNDTYSIEDIVVYDTNLQVLLSLTESTLDETPNPLFKDEAFTQIAAQAMMTQDLLDPKPALGLLEYRDQIYFVASAAILPGVLTQKFPKPEVYGALLMTRPLDELLLHDWSKDFNLHDIKLQPANTEIPARYISTPLLNTNDKPIATFVWRNIEPGRIFIAELLPIGSVVLIFLTIMAIIFAYQINSYISVILKASNDIFRQKEDLKTLAHTDTVTQLPNRLLGIKRLTRALQSSIPNQRFTALLFIDVDDFKMVNDTHGHDFGDKLLSSIGQLLSSCIRAEIDTVARYAGDEFIIILDDIKRQQDAQDTAAKILQKLTKGLVVDAREIKVNLSIGIASTSMPETAASETIIQADSAMYIAKKNGGAQFVTWGGA